MKYTYYRPNKQVIGLHVTKKSFKDAVKLISGRLDVSEPPEVDYDKYTITFKQDRLFDTSEQTAQLGDWITSENAEARVYTDRDYDTLLASGAYSTAATMVATARQVIAEHPERADSELAQLESALRAQSVDKNKA